MSTCPACKHTVITGVVHGAETVLLDPHYRTWVGVELTHFFPEDGDRVFQSSALVEHAAVCPAQRQAQAQAREQGKETYAQRKRVS
jgi:hypothetical protein